MVHDVGSLIQEVMAVYHEADEQTQRLADATGMHCPSGCGRCCYSPKIMASVLEVLPLAMDIYRTDDENRVMDVIEAKGPDPLCVMFQADAEDADRGRCTRYGVRPLVCRMFGFTARRNKYDQLEASICRVIKATQSHACQRAEMGLNSENLFPVLQDFSARISHLNPQLGYRMLPINQALGEALAYLYWKWPRNVPRERKKAS